MRMQHSQSAPVNRALLALAVVANAAAWVVLVYWTSQFVTALWRWATEGV